MAPRPPLYRTLRTARRSYVYDAASSVLLRAGPVLRDVLPLLGRTEMSAIVGRLAPRHGRRAVADALGEVADARKRWGSFSAPAWVAAGPDLGADELAAYAGGSSHLTLCVTERCNLRCRYCLHTQPRSWTRPHRDRDMPVATALAAVRAFVARGRAGFPAVISFYGGEPLLRLDLIRRVVGEIRLHPAHRDIRLSVDTNGTLIDDATAAFLVEHGFHLQLSLDGGARAHDANRVAADGTGSHARIRQGLERLVTLDPGVVERLSIQATLAPPGDLEDLIAFLDGFPLTADGGSGPRAGVRVNVADLDGLEDRFPGLAAWSARNRAARLRLRDAYIAACATGQRRTLSPAVRALFDPDVIRLRHRPQGPRRGPWRPPGSCLPGCRRLFVKVDGTLQPCERVGEGMTIGSVEEGVDPVAVRRLRQEMMAMLGDRCGGCWAHRLCDVCQAALAPLAARPEPERGRELERLCAGVRARMEQALILYASLMETADAPEALRWLRDSRMV